MENAKSVVSVPELTPIEGIVAIRKIVGQWLKPEGTKPRDAIAGVANVLLGVSLPVMSAPLTVREEAAKQVLETMQAIELAAAQDIKPPTHFTGLLSNKKVDIVNHLEDMIDQACHKPGEWRVGRDGAGSIDGMTFTESYDLQIGQLRQQRDTFLAIEAVNALPELIQRIRGAEQGERAADIEVQRLQGLLQASDEMRVDLADRITTASNMPKAWDDVLKERARQVTEKGYTYDRDDTYASCEMAAAAATYALCTKPEQLQVCGVDAWPWGAHEWKPETYRQNLIKAGALILAEIERVDRTEAPKESIF